MDEEKKRPVVRELEDSDVGQWEGPEIPMDNVEASRKHPVKKVGGYDLWTILAC